MYWSFFVEDMLNTILKPQQNTRGTDRLVFDPNTMKVPNFLEELDQGNEKAFGGNAESKKDSLLYVKLPPKLKRSVNKPKLENGTYDQGEAHFEKELKINALEESNDLPLATRASSGNVKSYCLTH